MEILKYGWFFVGLVGVLDDLEVNNLFIRVGGNS